MTDPASPADRPDPGDPAPAGVLRVLVVDDHALVRAGVRSELAARAADLDVVGEEIGRAHV